MLFIPLVSSKMQPITLLLSILIFQSACVIFILIERTDVTVKVATEIIPHLSDLGHTMDATRATCGHHRHRANATATGLAFLDAFPEITAGVQRSEALALHALVGLIAPKSTLLIAYTPHLARALLSAVPPGAAVTAVADVPSLSAENLLREFPNFRFSSAGAEHFPPTGRYDFVLFAATVTPAAFRRIPLAPLNAVIAVHGTGLHTLYPPAGTQRETETPITTNKGPGTPHNPAAYDFARRIAKELRWEQFDVLSTRAWRHGFTLLQERRHTEKEDY
jgi:hypothetical protein